MVPYRILSKIFCQVELFIPLSDPVTQHEGVPQVSVFSCTFFALAINGLASCMPPAIDNSLYVNDFAMFTCSVHLPAAKRLIQLALNLAFNWNQRHGFKFSPSKTVTMHFTLYRGVLPPPSFRLGSSVIRHVVEIKFLGVILDSKLYYTAHIKDLPR